MKDDQMYAKWDQIEDQIHETILDFLAEGGWFKPEAIARDLAASVMNHLDGYTAKDMS